MGKLTVENKREIRQLWDVANKYFELAKILRNRNKNHIKCKSKKIASFYQKGIPKEKYQRELNFLLAHLSSSAVRLCTIQEIFVELEYATGLPESYKKERKQGETIDQLTKVLIKKKEYIYQLLRDNICHRERAKPKDKDKKTLWEARQRAIEKMTIAQIFDAMQGNIKKFENYLRKLKLL